MSRYASIVAFLLAATAPTLAADGGKPGSAGEEVAPSRFGQKQEDAAFGAFQRGLYLTALNLAKPRAEAGDGQAQTLMAEIYSRGLGVRQDPAKAAELYGKAAEQGVPEAQFQYALILLDGEHAKKDRERAFTLMRSAADAGNRFAQFNYAQMLVGREPGGEGLRKAVPYYELAAGQGLADAQYAMAQVHMNGVGGRRVNEAEARRWLEKAALQNFDSAQVELGTMLVQSGEGEAAEKLGYQWLKRAAESGNVAGQIRLARLYRAGIGVERDPVEAGAWYILARRAGLTDRQMDSFLYTLDPDQQKQALERANRLR
ncbi:MAG: sel1 repeat family protein [Rhizobiaceae bacterium]|nr:sel1 repeat family protein [Rhizobiaceae bacterium]MCV0407320.1 sel1 repeat family protein [Rhizobiaceae bacterium]